MIATPLLLTEERHRRPQGRVKPAEGRSPGGRGAGGAGAPLAGQTWTQNQAGGPALAPTAALLLLQQNESGAKGGGARQKQHPQTEK